MGRLALGLVGAAAGFALGSPGLGWSLGLALGGQLFPTRSRTSQEGPRLQDLNVAGSSYGVDKVNVFGSMRVPCNLIWADAVVEHKVVTEEEVESGGKGGGASQTVVTTSYTYSCSFACLGSRGPIYAFRRIWLNKDLSYHVGEDAASSTYAQSLTLPLTTYTGTGSQGIDPTIQADKGADTPAYRHRSLLVFADLDLTGKYFNRLPTVEAEIVENGTTAGSRIQRSARTPAHIIETLCERAGIASGLIDTSGLSGSVHGYVTTQGSYAAKIQPILDAYFIDAVQTGDGLAFRPRASSSVMTIPYSDLAAGPEATDQALEVTRAREHDMPAMVQVDYFDVARDYQASSQMAHRSTGNASAVLKLPFNIAMTAAQAKQLAEATLYAIWIGRTRYRWTLPYRYLALEPGDVVTIQAPNADHAVKITRITYGANGVIECEGVAHDAAVYTSAADTDAFSDPIEIPSAGDATSYFLNLPALSTAHNDPGYYAGATSAAPDWLSATVFRSADGGETYAAQYVLSPFLTVGAADDVLADADWYTWDDVSTVTVTLTRGTLESRTDDAVLAGANRALLGDEIIQFGTATLVGTDQYELSHLLRGRRGTEWATGTHAASERFVLLSGLRRVTQTIPEIGASFTYRAVSNGQQFEDADDFTFTGTGERLKPWAPVLAEGARDMSDNLTITWTRRDRLGEELPDGVELLMSEATEAYDIEIMDGSDVVRTLTSTEPEIEYSAADQATDFGSAQASIDVRIYQRSAIVGRGRALEATV